MSTCPAGHESASTDYCDTCGVAMAAPATPAESMPSSPVTDAADAAEVEQDSGSSGAVEAGAAASGEECPNCGEVSVADALFCEACGYDFTTGALPSAAATSPFTLPQDEVAAPAPPPTPAAPQSADPPVPAPAAKPTPPPAAPESPAPGLTEPWVAEVWIDPQWFASQESPDPLPSQGPPLVVPLRHTSLLVGRRSVSRGIDPDIDCGVDNGVSRRHAQLTTDGSRWWVEDLDSSNGTFVSDVVGEIPTTPIRARSKVELSAEARVYLGSWTRLVVRRAAPGEIP